MSTTAATVREHPILFGDEMVRAILDGRKTQTRRMVKLPNRKTSDGRDWLWWLDRAHSDRGFPTDADGALLSMDSWHAAPAECYRNWYLHVPNSHPDDVEAGECVDRVYAPWRAGDRLWVREAWAYTTDYDGQFLMDGRKALYRADNETMITPRRWRPSIHMPRWASRITLEITAVRVERVQDITDADAIAEGAQCAGVPASLTNRGAFSKLWDRIHGEGAWARNDWVWVVEFQRTKN
jgi:hypothetical protein